MKPKIIRTTKINIRGNALPSWLRDQLIALGSVDIEESEEVVAHLPLVKPEDKIYEHSFGHFGALQLIRLIEDGFTLISYPGVGVWIRIIDQEIYVLTLHGAANGVIYSVSLPFFKGAYLVGKETSMSYRLTHISSRLDVEKALQDPPTNVGTADGLEFLNWPVPVQITKFPPKPKRDDEFFYRRNTSFDAALFRQKIRQGIKLINHRNYTIVRKHRGKMYIFLGDGTESGLGKFAVVDANSFMQIFDSLKSDAVRTRIEQALLKSRLKIYQKPVTLVAPLAWKYMGWDFYKKDRS